MNLFADDSEEAASYHACRTAPHGSPVEPALLARGGAYAASLAWAGHHAQHGRPDSIAMAQHVTARAAEAFIEETVKERDVAESDAAAAKRQALEKIDKLLRAEYSL